jgi:hypothetical protein
MLKHDGKILYRKKRPKEQPSQEKVFFDILEEGLPKPSSAPKKADSVRVFPLGGGDRIREVSKISQDEGPLSQRPEGAGLKTTRKRRFSKILYVSIGMMALVGFAAGWQFWKHSRPRISLPFTELNKKAAPSAAPEGEVIYPLKPFVVPLAAGNGHLALIFLDLSISNEAMDFLEANLAVVRSEIFRTLYSRWTSDPTSEEALNQAAHAVSLQLELNEPVKLYCKKITTI